MKNSSAAAEAKRKLHEAAPGAAKYIAKVATGKAKRPGAIRCEQCQYILNQVLGKPKQALSMKQPADGLSYQEIVDSAAQVLKQAKAEGVPLIAEAEEFVKKLEAIQEAHKKEQAEAEKAGAAAVTAVVEPED